MLCWCSFCILCTIITATDQLRAINRVNNLKCSGPVQYERQKSDKVYHQHVLCMQLPHQWLHLDAPSPSSGFVGWSRKTWKPSEQQEFGGVGGKRMTVEEEESTEEEISPLELPLFWIQLTQRRLVFNPLPSTHDCTSHTSLFVYHLIWEAMQGKMGG